MMGIGFAEFMVIGVSTQPAVYGIAKNNFRNMPDSVVGAYLYPTPAPSNP